MIFTRFFGAVKDDDDGVRQPIDEEQLLYVSCLRMLPSIVQVREVP
jgi:hypothetical protein